MKPAFLFFFFATLVLDTCFAQPDTALVGKYVSAEQRGLHTYPGGAVGDLHYLPYTYQGLESSGPHETIWSTLPL